jgi:ribonuclease III
VNINLDRLSRLLDYQFKSLSYLKQALTHRSAGALNYERYEFLGDSILSFVIANELFHLFPSQSEGQLSTLRAFLVKGDTLAEIGLELSLGDFLFLGQGELKSGGFRRASILADALEAIFAAIFLDGGIEAAQAVILKLYRARLDATNLLDTLKDAKTELQEYLQSGKKPLPQYKLTNISGDEHDQIFHVTCSVKGIEWITQGDGPTRRKAEQRAAKLFLGRLRGQ